MEDLSDQLSTDAAVEHTLSPEQERIAGLLGELSTSRTETAVALTRFATFRRTVRATVIENIKDGTICRAGANEALENWGEEPYIPRYNVRVQLDVNLSIEADDEDDARYKASEAITVDSDEGECEIEDSRVRYVEEVSES